MSELFHAPACEVAILDAAWLIGTMDERISKAWRRAAIDLGIRVVTPFEMVSESGVSELFEAHILDFGGPKGTVVGNQDGDFGQNELRSRMGYYASNLHASYRTYTKQFFIDTLNDWKWFGEPGREPEWYTGKPWS
jgi:hypothetical protein